jgi:hypothetical protein
LIHRLKRSVGMSDSELRHFFVLGKPAYTLVTPSALDFEDNAWPGSP